MRARTRNQGGFIVSIELLFIIAIVVAGVVIGWGALQDAVVNELSDTAAAIDSLNQTYSYGGFIGHNATAPGSAFTDYQDFCDAADNFLDQAGEFGRCITALPAAGESVP